MLGLGATGFSMARWLSGRGDRVRVADSRSEPPFAAQLRAELPNVELRTGPFEPGNFAGIDQIAISPGLPIAEPNVQAALARGIEVVGDIELFARVRKSEFPKARVIAITGSNGKSTVTEMVGAMCRQAGIRTLVAGNIGLPILDALQEMDSGARRRPDIFVLELSSFQLETTYSLDAEAAVILNLSEDHLDRYPGMQAYAAAKRRVFLGGGAQVLNREDPAVAAMREQGRHVYTFGTSEPWHEQDFGIREIEGEAWLAQGRANLMPASALKVSGLHNAQNALAALALCRALNIHFEPLLDALHEFKGLPHRVQKVADVNGVAYYDDSKGTNVGATVAALKGMSQKVVLIAGGDGKGQDFGPLRDAVAQRARAVVLIGRDREAIAAVLEGSGVQVTRAQDMPQAVRLAATLARPGDVVLLSPACASFDMFRNYEHRAQVFAEAVRALEAAN
ncbi:MAG TPA: UDP-N-acetylmuramoyl-L-alanine--D-glutamate ligase [Burkholderiales bacterium]|nr:UDP-N-acetylmuramoyl-L-alanine--D-glutamate ligase [Burkholderiales bacterium]